MTTLEQYASGTAEMKVLNVDKVVRKLLRAKRKKVSVDVVFGAGRR